MYNLLTNPSGMVASDSSHYFGETGEKLVNILMEDDTLYSV